VALDASWSNFGDVPTRLSDDVGGRNAAAKVDRWLETRGGEALGRQKNIFGSGGTRMRLFKEEGRIPLIAMAKKTKKAKGKKKR
jgi:hypothetical protein